METARAVRFVDSTGRQWVVREAPPPRGAIGSQRAPSLLFETEGMIRRVRRYPPDWEGLGSAELERLSWRT